MASDLEKFIKGKKMHVSNPCDLISARMRILQYLSNEVD